MDIIIMVLLIIGILLCMVEIYVPGFGVFGVSGVICLILSTIISWLYFDISIYIIICIQLIISIIVAFILYYIFKKTDAINKVILKTSLKEDYNQREDALVNKTGVVKTTLRPVGSIIVDGNVYEAISHDGMIDKNAKIVVVSVNNNKIIVRKG